VEILHVDVWIVSSSGGSNGRCRQSRHPSGLDGYAITSCRTLIIVINNIHTIDINFYSITSTTTTNIGIIGSRLDGSCPRFARGDSISSNDRHDHFRIAPAVIDVVILNI
jgi:hypothetical protein